MLIGHQEAFLLIINIENRLVLFFDELKVQKNSIYFLLLLKIHKIK